MNTLTIKNKIAAAIALAATFSTVALLALGGTTSAIGEGQIEGGDIYRVRNVTKGTSFSDPSNADKCETVQYKVRLHNPGPGEVDNVNVKVNLPGAASTQNVSTATISAQNAQPATRSDTATLNLASALSVSYIPGSTQLLDTNSAVIRALPDGITGGGVNIGKVGVSLNEIKFVQFKAKTTCPDTPPPPQKQFKCKTLNATMVDRTHYKLTAVAEAQNVTVQSYDFKVTRNSNTVDQKTVTTGALTAQYDFNQSEAGTYLITAVVNTSDGATNPNDCAVQVTITEEGTPPPPPVTPPPSTPPSTPPQVTTGGSGGAFVSSGGETALPDTGPGDTAAVITAVVAVSSTAYYIAARRFNF